jgi:hypothetical protein
MSEGFFLFETPVSPRDKDVHGGSLVTSTGRLGVFFVRAGGVNDEYPASRLEPERQ